MDNLLNCVFETFIWQHVPPLEVKDLFEDIKDGVMLLALLEVLSGQKLVSLRVISPACDC